MKVRRKSLHGCSPLTERETDQPITCLVNLDFLGTVQVLLSLAKVHVRLLLKRRVFVDEVVSGPAPPREALIASKQSRNRALRKRSRLVLGKRCWHEINQLTK